MLFPAIKPSSPSRVASIALYFVFLAFLFLVVFYIHGGEKIPGIFHYTTFHGDGVDLSATRAQIIETFEGSDHVAYAKGADVIREKGFKAYTDLGFANWPPGLSVIELFFSLISDHAPMPFCLLALTLVLWAWVFWELCRSLREATGLLFLPAFLAPLLILLAPFFTQALLWKSVLASESISSPLFALSMLSLWRCFYLKNKARIADFIIAGIFFTCASYVRAQFDIIFIVLSVTVAMICFAMLCRHFRLRGLEPFYTGRFLFGLLVILTTYIALTSPYRMLLNTSPIPIADNSYMWQIVWHDDAYFGGSGAFFPNGGGNLVCKVNPTQCAAFMEREKNGHGPSVEEAKSEALKTVLYNPVTFFSQKLPYMWRVWFTDILEEPLNDFVVAIIVNLAMIFFIPVMAIILLYNSSPHRVAYFALYFITLAAVVIGATGFSMVVHFEPRYLLPVKVFLFLSEASALAYAVQRIGIYLCSVNRMKRSRIK